MLVVAMFALVGFAGCATVNEELKAKPSAGAGFVPMEDMSTRADLPFQKVWVKSGTNWNVYRTIYIKPVNTQYLLEANWWQQNFRRDDYANHIQNVANYMQQKFVEVF